MRIPHDCWVVVADGRKYMVLRNHADDERVDLRVHDVEEGTNPPTRDQGTDKPGRLHDPARGRSAVADTDWHDLEEERFAEDLAERLNGWALAGRLERFVLAADPRTLGRLRPELHKEAEARLLGDVDKDLTSLTIEDIERVLGKA